MPYINKEMGKPIELGLVLEGEDALEFHRYIKNPTDTPKGKQLLQEAYEESQHYSLK